MKSPAIHFSPRFLPFLLSALFLAPFSSQAATELIDFGGNGLRTIEDPNGLFWNNVTDSSTLPFLPDLVDTTNMSTGISLQVTSRFNSTNTNGTSGSSLYPSSATSDSLFGNTGTAFNGVAAPNPTFTLSGLTVGVPYDFTFYASRIGTGGERRTTDYFVSGSINGSTTLNVSENVNGSASVFGITPTPEGQITITLMASADNANTHKFIYLGVLEIQSVPEPTSAALCMGGLLVLLNQRRRRALPAA
ncbi:MAG: hypothetical protein V4710_08675 [Verrucomicrobiota bacterium]